LVGVGLRLGWVLTGAMMVAVARISSMGKVWGWYRLVCAGNGMWVTGE